MTGKHLIARYLLMPALIILMTANGAFGTATAATYYVAKTGNNSNSCSQAQNVSTPKLTIAAGLACLGSGDTLQIRAGTYAEAFINNVVAGTATAYTVIRNYPGERPIIRPNATHVFFRGNTYHHIEFRGLELDGTAQTSKGHRIVSFLARSSTQLDTPHHIRFVDNTMHDSANHMVFVEPEANVGDHEFLNNEMYRNGVLFVSDEYAPGFNTFYNMGNRAVIAGNYIHNVCHGPTVFQSVRQGKEAINGVIIRNNLLEDIGNRTTDPYQNTNCGSGITWFNTGTGGRVYNNIITRAKFGIRHKYGTGVKILNNTVYSVLTGGQGIQVEDSSNPEIRNNILYQAGKGIYILSGATATISHNLTTDPLFVNPLNRDFRLKSGSSAINAGLTLAEVPFDFASIRRPQGGQHDIGAFEFNGTTALPEPPPNLKIF